MRRHLGKKNLSFGCALSIVLGRVALSADISPNLLMNPGFESPVDTSGNTTDTTATGWTFYGGDCVRVDNPNHTPGGQWSIWQQTSLPAPGGIYQNVAVEAPLGPPSGDGTPSTLSCTLSCYYYFESAEPTVPGEVSDLALTFLNASDQPVGPVDANGYSDATYIPSRSVTTTGAWLPFSVSGVAPSGATQVQVSFDFTGGAKVSGPQAAYVDDADLQVEEENNYPMAWAVNGSGDWNTSQNWTTGSIPNGAGQEADFESVITSAQTVFTNTPITAGTLHFNNPNEYVIAGAGSLTLETGTGQNALLQVDQGTDELDLPVTLSSNTTLNVASGATLIIANPLTIDSGVTLTQSGGGTVTYQSIINLLSGASIAFGDSTRARQLSLGPSNRASIAGTDTVLELDSLSDSGTVDVQNNTLLINYGDPVGGTADPVASIRAQLVSGYASGRWNGPGINSSAVTGNPGYGVGYADSADPGNPAGLAPGTIEVKYTLYGDANLDRVVNGTDFAILATHFGQQSSGWDEGDFNYDGSVDGADFGLLASNFGKQVDGAAVELPDSDWAALDAFAATNGLMTDVPEPLSSSLCGFLGLALLCRQQRAKAAARL